MCLQKIPVIDYAQVDMSKKRVSQQEQKQTADIECDDAVTENKGTTVSIQNMLNVIHNYYTYSRHQLRNIVT